jgi:predicted transcriptional regulator
MPQSTIATNIQVLEESDLIDTETGRATEAKALLHRAHLPETRAS